MAPVPLDGRRRTAGDLALAGGGRLHGDFVQTPGRDVIDESAHFVLAGDEGAGLDPGDGLAHVLLQVRERLEPERRPDAGVLLDLGADLVVLERQHAAVAVVDQDDFLGAQQPLRDRQRTDRVHGGGPARVAEDMGVAFPESQDLADVQPGVHAGEDDVRAVIDPGMVPEPAAILGPLGELVHSPDEITDVIFSHHHPDHTLNAALFPRARFHDFWAIYRGDIWERRPAAGFALSPSIRLMETPGHTPQDISTIVSTSEGTVAF